MAADVLRSHGGGSHRTATNLLESSPWLRERTERFLDVAESNGTIEGLPALTIEASGAPARFRGGECFARL